jgi:hypothetical protein
LAYINIVLVNKKFFILFKNGFLCLRVILDKISEAPVSFLEDFNNVENKIGFIGELTVILVWLKIFIIIF